jgi:hypothetical protein
MTALTGRLPDPVVGLGDLIPLTLSLDTLAYSDGDVLADMQALTDFLRAEGGRAIIQSLTVLDKDDQGVAFDVLVSPNANSLGSENSAPAISDANAEGLQRLCRVETSDYIDLGGCRLATVRNLGLVVEAAPGSTTLYVGAITRGGSPTYSAAGLILYFGVLWD